MNGAKTGNNVSKKIGLVAQKVHVSGKTGLMALAAHGASELDVAKAIQSIAAFSTPDGITFY